MQEPDPTSSDITNQPARGARMRMSLRAFPFSAVAGALARSRDASSFATMVCGVRAFSGSAHSRQLVPLRPAQPSYMPWQRREFSTVPMKQNLDEEERENLKIKRLIAAKQKRDIEKITIKAKTRPADCRGTPSSVALRKTGWVPGRLQDSEGTNELLHVESKSVRRWCIEARALSTVFQLYIDDRPPTPVLIRELQAHYVHYDEPMHVTMVKYEKGIDYLVEIPVNLVNQDKSPGIRIGGALNLNMRTIKVKIAGGTPIPVRIEVDLAGLEVGDRIFLRDVKLPEGIQMADLPHYKTISILRIAKTRASMGLV